MILRFVDKRKYFLKKLTNYLKCDISESYNLKFSKDEGKTWYEYDKEINIDSKNIIVSAYNNYELNYITYNFINY